MAKGNGLTRQEFYEWGETLATRITDTINKRIDDQLATAQRTHEEHDERLDGHDVLLKKYGEAVASLSVIAKQYSSDRKWLMGILASVIVALVIMAFTGG